MFELIIYGQSWLKGSKFSSRDGILLLDNNKNDSVESLETKT